MQKTGIDALKRMALMAKNRLRKKVNENDNKNIKNRGQFKVIYGDSVDIKSKIITREDRKLYEKVKNMLEQEGEVINPMARLIDYKIYNNLEDNGKERYLFDMLDKYKKYKQKYNDEKQQEVV